MLVKLSADISFLSLNGHTITLLKGTEVTVLRLDAETLIASDGTYQFDITPDDFVTFH